MATSLTTTETPIASPGLMRRLSRNLSGMVGLVIVTVFVVIAILGALGITPYPSVEQHMTNRLKAPIRPF